jgi:hypothetical protein
LKIYTELDFLRIGSRDWVLWTLKPEGYIILWKPLTSSVSQNFKEDRSSRILRVADKTFPREGNFAATEEGRQRARNIH